MYMYMYMYMYQNISQSVWINRHYGMKVTTCPQIKGWNLLNLISAPHTQPILNRSALILCIKCLNAADSSRKLTLLYVANDVIQNSKKKGPEYRTEFVKVLPRVFQGINKLASDFTYITLCLDIACQKS